MKLVLTDEDVISVLVLLQRQAKSDRAHADEMAKAAEEYKGKPARGSLWSGERWQQVASDANQRARDAEDLCKRFLDARASALQQVELQQRRARRRVMRSIGVVPKGAR